MSEKTFAFSAAEMEELLELISDCHHIAYQMNYGANRDTRNFTHLVEMLEFTLKHFKRRRGKPANEKIDVRFEVFADHDNVDAMRNNV